MSIFRQTLNDFSHLVFPHNCVSCDYALDAHEELICDECRKFMPTTGYWRYDDNPISAIFYGRIPCQRACGYLSFTKGGRVQQMLHYLKYGNKPEVGEMLGKMFGEHLKTSAYAEVDVIIPVPLHANKLKKRGYNQCDHIAKGISDAMSKPWKPQAVSRVKANESQTKKGRYDRWINVNELFVLNNPIELENKHVLLIDDVITTGSTLEACARAVLSVSKTKLSIATIACPSIV